MAGTQILMPALSPTMTEGKLARWLKKEGEEVKAGDVIAEIETDKATMEVEAVDEGTLSKIMVPEGTEGVQVNAVIAVLNGEGGAAAAPAPKAEAPKAPSPGAAKGFDPQPESVPINSLVQVAGTPLHGTERLDPFEYVRTVAVARITMPKSHVRLSAGRQELGEAIQALCFFAGANSIFYGDKLLTTGNPEAAMDRELMGRLGLSATEQS